MSPTQAIYLVNVLICAVLALLLTFLWKRTDRERSLGTFMATAWFLLAADVSFFIRASLPFWAGRFFPTLFVTVGQILLLMGANRVTGRPDGRRLAIGITVAHAVVLTVFLVYFGGISSLRTILNGVIWGGLSFAAAAVLIKAPDADVRTAMGNAALVFVLHGSFHLFRSFSALLTLTDIGVGTPAWIQVAGDVEVAVFMVGLFGALLVGYALLHGKRLLATERELRELSTLLPVCAWCKNVRSDQGYWQRIEDYFASRGNVRVTHGMCDSCQAKALAEEDSR